MRDQIAAKKSVADGSKPFKFMPKWSSSLESSDAHSELSQSMVPPELLSNLGVLQQQEDRDEAALGNYKEALANCDKLLKEGNAEDKRVLALRTTIRFNMACCHDKASRIGEASEIFKAIIKE